ncbi:HipA domain-containing protein [Microbacterium testaceum]|uniref:HipA domain-containing protein n=1 Tax=Microbacterium testaceum TaxID=2033 RepID=UPI003436271D
MPHARQWATPLDSTPTTHIVKPAVPPYSEHHIVEYMTMAAARHLGLDVAESEMATTSEGDDVFISRRYDRTFTGERWARLHQEDLCQALGVEPDKKYQSDGGPGVGKVADLFRGLPSGSDRQSNSRGFFDALAFNLAAVGTDAHAKNYSLLLNGSRATLAPLYDLGTHAPYPTPEGQPVKLAMSLDGEYVVDRVGENALQVAGRQLGLGPDEALLRARKILRGIVSAFDQAAVDAIRVLGNVPTIARVRDAIADNARARGWVESTTDIPLND